MNTLSGLFELGPTRTFLVPLPPQAPPMRKPKGPQGQSGEFFSFEELAERWCCSRGTVRNRLRALGAAVLDFAPAGRRGKKVVAKSTVLAIESKRSKRLC